MKEKRKKERMKEKRKKDKERENERETEKRAKRGGYQAERFEEWGVSQDEKGRGLTKYQRDVFAI